MEVMALSPRVLAAALLLRGGVIVYGMWHDAHLPVRYTDVDYDVFTDAARSVVAGGSPYERQTYRYPLTLALLLAPTVWWFWEFGKVLFAVADVGVGYVLGAMGCGTPLVCGLWLFNPVVVNVSTRGNADSLAALPIVLALLWLMKYLGVGVGGGRGGPDQQASTARAACDGGRGDGGDTTAPTRAAAAWHLLVASAAALGVAIHLRLFPVIFLPAACLALLAADGGRSGVWPRLFQGTAYAAVALGTFAGLTSANYAACGQEFLENAYLYHGGRVDHRHNLSPHFLPGYLGGGVLGGFAAQALPILVTCTKYRRQPAFAWFLVTALFVSLNKVCTVQYFTWYFCLAPAAAGELRRVPTAWAAAAAALWAAALALWLATAYFLEFTGRDGAHHEVWGASLGFLAANAFAIGVLVAKRG